MASAPPPRGTPGLDYALFSRNSSVGANTAVNGTDAPAVTDEATYKDHFFGREDYRRYDLIQSISIHGGLHDHSARVLGESHPLTRKIFASFLKCFDEQLDWSLGDLPRPYLEYRAKLLGD